MNRLDLVSFDTNEVKKYFKTKENENSNIFELPIFPYDKNDKTYKSKITYDKIEEFLVKEEYVNAMKELTLIEKKILYLKYIEEMSINEMAKKLNISKQLVKEIDNYAIERFNKYLIVNSENKKIELLKNANRSLIGNSIIKRNNKNSLYYNNKNSNNTINQNNNKNINNNVNNDINNNLVLYNAKKSLINNQDAKVIYKKIFNEFNRIGYINLNHKNVNSKEDLVQVAKIFRDPRYETFRLIYMCGNRIAGYESVSSKIPSFSSVFCREKDGSVKAEKNFYKIKDRMRRLNADGYYMVHNHPSGRAVASKSDLGTTCNFYKNVEGFLGHLIVNNESYAWIDVDKYWEEPIAENEIPIKDEKAKSIFKNKDESILITQIENMKIKSKKDLVMLMHNIKNSPNYSIVFFMDVVGNIRMVMDLPNRFMNINQTELKNYFKNRSVKVGASRVILVTDNEEVYNKALKHYLNGTFVDIALYKELDSELYVYDLEEKYKDKRVTNIFNDDYKSFIASIKKASVCENEFMNEKREIEVDDDIEVDLYINEMDKNNVEKEKEEKEKNNKEVTILLKKAGKAPVVKKIPNTLEAKQQLVGGYIEVVPFDDCLIICNDEGKLLNMPPNLVFDFDYIAGDCFVIGDDYERGDFKSLTREEIVKYRQKLKDVSFKYPFQKEQTKKKTSNLHGEKFR